MRSTFVLVLGEADWHSIRLTGGKVSTNPNTYVIFVYDLSRICHAPFTCQHASPIHTREKTMPAQIQFEPDGTCVLRGSGTLKQSEFAGIQKQIAGKIEQGAKPRLLAILENFEGWERGVDWNDLDFLMAYSDAITKIAIVGQPDWEAHALAFAGAGVRRAPVKFFPSEQMAQARIWLAE